MSEESIQPFEADAWKQMHDLQKRFTKEWEIRYDLEVTALAHRRCVRLRVGEYSLPSADSRPRPQLAITERNISTMRELAGALLAACDFVEQSNPKWAGPPALDTFFRRTADGDGVSDDRL